MDTHFSRIVHIGFYSLAFIALAALAILAMTLDT
jgi:hypothetical protein